MNRKNLIPLLGAAGWILGLILFIFGLNIKGNIGSWLNVIGSILFLIGLGLEGIVWARRKKEEIGADPGSGKTEPGGAEPGNARPGNTES